MSERLKPEEVKAAHEEFERSRVPQRTPNPKIVVQLHHLERYLQEDDVLGQNETLHIDSVDWLSSLESAYQMGPFKSITFEAIQLDHGEARADDC